MATPINAGDDLEVVFYCQSGPQVSLNVSHWVVSTAVGAPTMEAVALLLGTAFAPLYKACMSSNATYNGVGVKRIIANPTDPVFDSTGNGVGDSVADIIPNQVAGLISFRSGLAGRSNRGRKYVPFPSEEQNTSNGKPTNDYLTALEALADGYLATQGVTGGGTTITVDCEIYSRKEGTLIPITSYLLRPFWATQRRRSLINRGDAVPPVP